MPITKSALKALRRDKRRTIVNKAVRVAYRVALKEAAAKKTSKAVATAYKTLDRAAKSHVLHANTAARLKSRLAGLIKRSGGNAFAK